MKTTHQHLVEELTAKDEVKYASIIDKAKKMVYHDFKSELAMPKVELVKDLAPFPELFDIMDAVKEGDYDEPPDESDKEDMRKDLRADGANDEFLKIFGL